MFNLVSFFVRARRFQETQRPSTAVGGQRQTFLKPVIVAILARRALPTLWVRKVRRRTSGARRRRERGGMFGQPWRKNATGANVGRVGKRWAITSNLDLRRTVAA
jgi:hypothetical protein